LNASYTEVFMAIKGDPTFRWPLKMRSDPYKRDHSRFCEYHGEHGHLTKDCMVLHREIENFVRNGKLIRFLALADSGSKSARNTTTRGESRRPQSHGTKALRPPSE
jgi:hypothetical protein